jgi:hypothetical protein
MPPPPGSGSPGGAIAGLLDQLFVNGVLPLVDGIFLATGQLLGAASGVSGG